MRSPGRLEIVKQSPTVLVDAAHNPGGARVLRKALEESFAFEKIYGVFSAMQDKNVEAVLGEMEP
ncbi:cyanophycin synthetase, partial [Staphylococcus aureus]|nr:cyanophycin synthetase [Staphylococcus aureus]